MPACKAQLQPCPTSAVASLAEQSKTYAALLACQNTVLGIITEPLNLIPSKIHPPLSIHGAKKEVNEEELDCTVGATIATWQHANSQEESSTVRWVSASALANAPLGFGTTRLMAWAGAHIVCPHFAIELGVMGTARGEGERAQGTISFAQRSDLVLDLDYLNKYYNTKGTGISSLSFNDVYNRCLGFQSTLNWHHYQVPQSDMKPIIANSISYTFPAEKESIQAFTDAAADVAQLWTELVIASEAEKFEEEEAKDPRWSQEHRVALVQKYDVRHEQVVRFDPGNMIAEKLFGKLATKQLLDMTVGRFN
ncbi:hypothetical protein Ndes2526B_g04993 [Nannochloris sp. 'desiccata']|nr:hypothetical protein KSW81_006154 [Chlorella desiccata (nom. nud.)]KAH7619726.1 hypothetical protein NADE_008014 [Chlorella desiccata (nom. nud.)]